MRPVALPVGVLAAGHAEDGGDAHFKENGHRQNERNGGQHRDPGRCSSGCLWDARSSRWPMPVPVVRDGVAVLRMGYWNGRGSREDPGNGLQAGLQASPQDEVLPEHHPAKNGKTRPVHPLQRGGVRQADEEGELFRVQSLVEPLFFVQRPDADSTQLFVMAHRIADRFLRRSSPSKEAEQHHDDGHHQQEMDKPAHRATGHQPQQPQNSQYCSNRPQRMIRLSGCSSFRFRISTTGSTLRHALALAYGVFTPSE